MSPVDDPPRDLTDLLGRLARCAPGEVGVVDAKVGPVSWGELWRRTLGLAGELRGAGIGAGDRVAVWLPNWSDALCWQFASAALGAHVVGVNTRYNVDEVAHMLVAARPSLVAVAHDFHGLDLAGRLRDAADRAGVAPSVAVVAGPGREPAEQSAGYDVGGGAWVPGLADETQEPGPEPRPFDPHRLAVAFTTSGSTGRPKLAAHSAGGVLTHALAGAEAIGLTGAAVVLCAIPLAGTFGFSTAMAALAGGATLVLEPVFDADAVLDDMVRHRVSHVAAGDDMVLRLERAWRHRRRDLSAWRWWGGADFQGRLRELATWAAEEFGTLTTGLYGSSEVFALASMWPPEVPAPRRWDAGGRVVTPRIEVRVADPDSGLAVPDGTRGELWFRGPNVVDNYLGSPEAESTAFTEDGWFRSGDLGVLAEPGVFTFVCRMGEALRLRGFLVDPAEIELRLTAHPDVDTAKVVGIPGPDGGTRAIGFVVPA
ncbi:MAG: AMP-binding protein, partial [Pseudonocardia sp.]|nr:AMP-binding protein [Pseudonocardia sp.]